MGTGTFPGEKQPGRGVDHPPLLASRLKKEQSYTSTPLWAFAACCIVNFTFTFTGESLVLPGAIQRIPVTRTCIVALCWGWRKQSPDIAWHLYRAVLANLLVFVRHCYKGDIAEGFRCCDCCEGKRLERSPSVRPSKEMGFCSPAAYGEAALTGAKKEFTSRLRSAVPPVIFQRW